MSTAIHQYNNYCRAFKTILFKFIVWGILFGLKVLCFHLYAIGSPIDTVQRRGGKGGENRLLTGVGRKGLGWALLIRGCCCCRMKEERRIRGCQILCFQRLNKWQLFCPVRERTTHILLLDFQIQTAHKRLLFRSSLLYLRLLTFRDPSFPNYELRPRAGKPSKEMRTIEINYLWLYTQLISAPKRANPAKLNRLRINAFFYSLESLNRESLELYEIVNSNYNILEKKSATLLKQAS